MSSEGNNNGNSNASQHPTSSFHFGLEVDDSQQSSVTQSYNQQAAGYSAGLSGHEAGASSHYAQQSSGGAGAPGSHAHYSGRGGLHTRSGHQNPARASSHNPAGTKLVKKTTKIKKHRGEEDSRRRAQARYELQQLTSSMSGLQTTSGSTATAQTGRGTSGRFSGGAPPAFHNSPAFAGPESGAGQPFAYPAPAYQYPASAQPGTGGNPTVSGPYGRGSGGAPGYGYGYGPYEGGSGGASGYGSGYGPYESGSGGASGNGSGPGYGSSGRGGQHS